MKYTFDEFFTIMHNLNQDMEYYFIQDSWVYHVEKAMRSGHIVSDRVLNCHGGIYFDQTGHAHSRNFMNRF